MKTLVFAMMIALIISGLFFTPAAAAASASAMTSSSCGNTYIVQRGDYLARIAWNCGISLSQILAYNPRITNPSRIYPGQVIYLTGNSTQPVTGTGGTYVVQWGDTLGIIAARYGTTIWALIQANPQMPNPSLIYAGQVIYLPGGTSTTPVTPPGTTGPRVTLSTLSVASGGTVKAYVYGFPAKADIDYRIGKKGASYSSVVDAVTDSNGYTSTTLTIPSSAKSGEKWVILVLTTNMRGGAEVTSSTITIK